MKNKNRDEVITRMLVKICLLTVLNNDDKFILDAF
jgi:hypothetical protein